MWTVGIRNCGWIILILLGIADINAMWTGSGVTGNGCFTCITIRLENCIVRSVWVIDIDHISYVVPSVSITE